jgi:cytochrome P450
MSSAAANTQRLVALPPGPSGKPIVGSLLDAWDNPLKLMLRSFSEHGPVSRFKFLWIPYMLIADADAAHHVLVSNAKAYQKSPNYDGLKIMLGQGLLTSEGEFWRRQRKLAQPAFHREKLAGFVDVMAECAEAMVREWRAGTETFDAHRAMMRLTFRVVGKTLLSVDLDGEARAVGEALDVALEWTNDYVEAIVRVPPWVPTAKNRRFLRAKETLDRLVTKVVVDRRAAMARGERVPNDLLQMLLEARDGDTGEAMSDEQLKNELLTLVLAGHETTANALTFGLYLLSKHRDVREKLRAEARAVLGDERAPTIADLPKLPYTLQVVEEVLRLYPPAWCFERIAIEDDVVGGFRVPKGTIVGIAPFVMHRNPSYFPDPERFDPERFNRAARTDGPERPKHAYVPFGGGARTCIGNAFALMEMQVILPILVRAFDLDPPSEFALELDPAVTLRPAQGLPVRATAL